MNPDKVVGALKLGLTFALSSERAANVTEFLEQQGNINKYAGSWRDGYESIGRA
jgi:hypothetical protein